VIKRSLNIDPDIGELWTIREVMETLKVSRMTVFRMIKSGELETVKVSTHVRITDRSLKALVHNNLDREEPQP
jgi:excisionase family DNA binding protein